MTSFRQADRDARAHFARNAWEPIAIPRWALTLKYAIFFIVGLLAFLQGVNTLNLTTFDGYEPIWAGFVGLGSLLAAFGSIRPKWASIEAAGGVVLIMFLLVLIVELFFRGGWSVGALLCVTLVVPGVRAGYLITRFVYRYRIADL